MNGFKNKYLALRHGESKANVAELIISNLTDDINGKYSLTEKGEEQVKISVEDAKEKGWLNNKTIIYSSPFSRCKRSAEIAKQVLGVKESIHIEDRLKERWFGAFDKTNTENYQKVWSIDQENKPPIENEETVESVEKRTMSLVADLEKKYNNETFLLVSHGDVLQILEACFSDISARRHRGIKPLQKAEIRALK